MKTLEEDSAAYDYTTWQVMQEYMPRNLLSDFSGRFRAHDHKKTGLVKIEDVAIILRSMGRNVSEDQIRVILQDLTGGCRLTRLKYLDFKEYVAVLSVLVTDCIPEDEMHRVFRQFDKDGDGFITPEELRNLLQTLGDEISDEDLDVMMREADRDGDGRVSYNEFIRVMTNSDGPEESVSTSVTTPTPPISRKSSIESESQLSEALLSDSEDEIDSKSLEQMIHDLRKEKAPRIRCYSLGSSERKCHSRTPPSTRRKQSLTGDTHHRFAATLPPSGKHSSCKSLTFHRRKKSLTEIFHLASSSKRRSSRQSCPDVSIQKDVLTPASAYSQDRDVKSRFSLSGSAIHLRNMFKRKTKQYE